MSFAPDPPRAMTTAADVARHLIRLAALDEEGEPMTAMRLHKLLYYCQGWFLAWYGRPLFADRLEAWMHGPVAPDVYALPWGRGRDRLPDPGGDEALSSDERAAVDQVWRQFGRYSAAGLRAMTHREPPWRDHYRPDDAGRSGAVIPPAELAEFFGAEFRRLTGEEPGSAAAAASGRATPHDQLMKELGW